MTSFNPPQIKAGGKPEDVPIVIDIEASGFGHGSYPIEIGYVMPDGKTFCALIRPAPEWTHWDEQAARTHGIARDIVVSKGREIKEVAQAMNDELHGKTVYCDGWANDYSWLNTLFEAADMTPSFKLEDLRVLLSEKEAPFWHVIKQQVGREFRLQRHRASSDARMLQLSLMRLRAPLPGEARA